MSRIGYGPFEINDTFDLSKVEEIKKNLLSIETIFDKNKKLIFDKNMEKEYYQGENFLF
ncbi:MAG: hypothetical protein Ct9H90mP2_08080 [Dehalococcoidia bacterium]|nr:MAG: hypothetical protein Ct9H90mP2_08080 [Dehalococcoidia bacterium]